MATLSHRAAQVLLMSMCEQPMPLRQCCMTTMYLIAAAAEGRGEAAF